MMNKYQKMIKNDHFLFLEESYNAVGKKTWKDKDFELGEEPVSDETKKDE